MENSKEFSAGFRINTIDVMVITAALLAVLLTYSKMCEVAFFSGYTVLHFFLFCNVFRIGRKSELFWSFVFVIMTSCTILLDVPSWMVTIASTFSITVVVIILELRKPSYHGILWEKINPSLRQW